MAKNPKPEGLTKLVYAALVRYESGDFGVVGMDDGENAYSIDLDPEETRSLFEGMQGELEADKAKAKGLN